MKKLFLNFLVTLLVLSLPIMQTYAQTEVVKIGVVNMKGLEKFADQKLKLKNEKYKELTKETVPKMEDRPTIKALVNEYVQKIISEFCKDSNYRLAIDAEAIEENKILYKSPDNIQLIDITQDIIQNSSTKGL